MPVNPGVYNGGVPIRGLVSLPATTEMLTVDSSGNMSRQAIPTSSDKLPLSGGTLTGPLVLPAGSKSAVSLRLGGTDVGTGLWGSAGGTTPGMGFAVNGVSFLQTGDSSDGLRLHSLWGLAWTSGAADGTVEQKIYRTSSTALGFFQSGALRAQIVNGEFTATNAIRLTDFNPSAPDISILRNATGPSLETRSAGGLRVRSADGSAAGALDALTYTSNKNDDSGVTPGFGWVDNAGAIGMAQWAGQNRLYFVTRGARRVMLNDTAMYLENQLAIGASMSNGSNGVYLVKDVNDTTLAQRNGVNPQTFRVYNTYTSATNGEWLQQQWGSNEARIGTSVGSAGGTQRNLVLGHWNSAGTWARRLTCLPDGSNLTLTSDIVTLESIGGGSFVRYGFGSWYASNNAIHLGSSGSRWGTLFSSAINTTGDVTLAEASNLTLGATTGTKIGTATTQRIGFFNATPVVQPSAVADATDAASVITQLNALLSRMRDLGLIAA